MTISITITQAQRYLKAAIRAKVAILLEGAPGIGKTTIVRWVGSALEQELAFPFPVHPFIGSNADAVDIAGLPWVEQGKILRALFPEIQACIDRPGLLFLDELTSVPPSVQAPLMRLFLERNAGGTQLHPESAVVAACNPPAQTAAATELSAATVNRLGRYRLVPTVAEVAAWFASREGDSWEKEARDLAATVACAPELICLEPPSESIDGGQSWASPRAWELGLRAWSADGASDSDDGAALLSGFVGEEQALAYLAIRRLREHLPTADRILAEPDKALVPAQKDHQIAALGLISQVADVDLWAAWIYVQRLTSEISLACARGLLPRKPPKKSPWEKQGKAAHFAVLARAAGGAT